MYYHQGMLDDNDDDNDDFFKAKFITLMIRD